MRVVLRHAFLMLEKRAEGGTMACVFDAQWKSVMRVVLWHVCLTLEERTEGSTMACVFDTGKAY